MTRLRQKNQKIEAHVLLGLTRSTRFAASRLFPKVVNAAGRDSRWPTALPGVVRRGSHDLTSDPVSIGQGLLLRAATGHP
jgi:hypothetical protein